jgi:hypothetical protein
LLLKKELDLRLKDMRLKAIGAAMLHLLLASFGDLFATSKTGNQQISCRDTAIGDVKRISLGSNTPADLSPGNGLRRINIQS